jgi:endonuclease/exonuclease/phosphatase family metal-dependent hydrolase
MRVVSWNLLWQNGAGIDDLGRLVETHRPDLVLMQEATLPADALTRQIGGFCVRKAMSGRLHGLAVWSPRRFTTSVESLPVASKFDLPVPLFRLIAARLALIVCLDGLQIATVHLDHGQIANRRQLRHLLRAHQQLHAVIGDFNALGTLSLPGFADVGPRCATHRVKGLVPLRLDRCLIRGLRCTNAVSLAYGKSDHRPILMDLEPI